MNLSNIQKCEQDDLDCKISSYYDNELNISNLMDFEARLLYSDILSEYVNKKCRENYIISQSIRLVKKKFDKKAEEIADDFIKRQKSKRLFLNFNPVFFKSFYKFFSDVLLNFNRHNS